MTPAILLVDDDDHVLLGLMRSLRQQPYQILSARSADEAMWCLKTHAVQVIVSDDQMPGMPGVELLAWAAKHFPGTARIMLTGKATAASAIKAINDAKVYRYFTKPCKIVDLAMTIRRALAEQGYQLEPTDQPAAATTES